MATKQGRKDYDKLLDLIHSMEDDYESVAFVPADDKRIKKCHSMVHVRKKSAYAIPIRVHIRDKTVACKDGSYHKAYNYFINEKGTVSQACNLRGVERTPAFHFFTEKGHVVSYFRVDWNGETLTAEQRPNIMKKLRSRGCKELTRTLIASYGLCKVYEINNIEFGVANAS